VPSPAAPASSGRENGGKVRHGTLKQAKDEEQASSRTKDTYLEEPDRRAPVDARRLGQGIVDRGVVVAKFLPQRQLSLGLVDAASTPAARRQRRTRTARRETLTPRGRAPGAATLRSHPPTSPVPRMRARGLAQIAPSIGPSQGQNHHQQGGPPPHGPWWAGSPNEPACALGEGRGGPMLVRPLPPLPVPALRTRS
jgi:hypothetical protein